jgi:adenosylhomocysteine nucleosidase
MLSNTDILIVCALEIETQEELNDWEPFTDDPVWNVVYTGVGKVNATYKLTERLTDYNWAKPKLVINYGTAGSQKIKKKQLVDCTKFVQRDMDVTGLGFMKGQTPFENDIPIILDYDHVKFNPIGKKLRCGTGDNFVQDSMDSYSDVFDMEAYALAKVCWLFSIPFISFKYITDGADEQSHEDWEENHADGIVEFKEQVLNKI